MTIIRFSKNGPSNGARALRDELVSRGHDAKMLKNEGSRYTYKEGHLFINWGSSDNDHGLNFNASLATDKASCLSNLQERAINCPDFTGSRSRAREWLDEGSSVVCRTLTRSSGGKGIFIATRPSELAEAPLYTRYIKKSEEYRVHVFNGRTIDVQRKARRSSVSDEDVNWQVRTSDNGFVFVREGVELPERAKQMAESAVLACRLDFGAVDLIYNAHRDAYYVLEINTAPGLEGQTIISYADAIERYLEERNA